MTKEEKFPNNSPPKAFLLKLIQGTIQILTEL